MINGCALARYQLACTCDGIAAAHERAQMHWSTIFYIFLTLAYFASLLLAAINELLDGSDQATVKRKVEDFWFFTAELSTVQKLSETLKARRNGTRKRIPTFIKLFWFLLVFVFISTVGNIFYRQDSHYFQNMFTQDVTFELGFDIQVTYLQRISSFDCIAGDNDCIEWTDLAGREATEGLVSLRRAYVDFINDQIGNHLVRFMNLMEV